MRTTVLFLWTVLWATVLWGQKTKPLAHVDSLRVKADLAAITKTPKSRSFQNMAILDQVADYIYRELGAVCDSVYYQTYLADGKTYRNVVGVLGLRYTERMVVGTHYDVCGNQEGADDNASGVAGLLELARLLAKDAPGYRIDFVAYSLEEPPYFRSEEMGSYVHAKYLADNQIPLMGMVCLEMIGYFDVSPRSQRYPIPLMKTFFGDEGDFIAVIHRSHNGRFGTRFARLMKRRRMIETHSLKGTADIQGVDFSDHRSYWAFGYPAVMVTNTAFFRNPNYHQAGDRMETLDIYRMCLVIEEVYGVLGAWR